MRKSPSEKGFIIPVKMRICQGKYAKAFAKSFMPDKNGNIKVCYDSGKTSTWKIANTIFVPEGFKRREGQLTLTENIKQDE